MSGRQSNSEVDDLVASVIAKMSTSDPADIYEEIIHNHETEAFTVSNLIDILNAVEDDPEDWIALGVCQILGKFDLSTYRQLVAETKIGSTGAFVCHLYESGWADELLSQLSANELGRLSVWIAEAAENDFYMEESLYDMIKLQRMIVDQLVKK